jgi:hypothetical protein
LSARSREWGRGLVSDLPSCGLVSVLRARWIWNQDTRVYPRSVPLVEPSKGRALAASPRFPAARKKVSEISRAEAAAPCRAAAFPRPWTTVLGTGTRVEPCWIRRDDVVTIGGVEIGRIATGNASTEGVGDRSVQAATLQPCLRRDLRHARRPAHVDGGSTRASGTSNAYVPCALFVAVWLTPVDLSIQELCY